MLKRKQTEREEPLVSLSIVCSAENEEKPFWFSSLGQMTQFGTIKFCRPCKNYFGQFVWIGKRATILVAFHLMKRRLIIVLDWRFLYKVAKQNEYFLMNLLDAPQP